jgi:repressor LexA
VSRTEIPARQLDVLRCIERSLGERGFPPTYREFQAELGLSSRQTVHEHLSKLEARGLLIRYRYEARGLQFTDAARELLARERAKGATTQ